MDEMRREFTLEGKQRFDKYILIAPGSDYGKAMWNDINFLENGIVLDKVIRSENKILNLLHHIHFSFRLNESFQLPFQRIWQKAYSLTNIKLESDKKYCVIYTDISAARTDVEYLKKIKEKENVELILVMVNTMARREKILKNRFRYFKHIFTFDKNDADAYKFIYHPANYSAVFTKKYAKISKDVFFVGVSKGRLEKIQGVYRKLKASGAHAEFYISGVRKAEQENIDIHYNEWLTYQEVLRHIEETNCIVEIMDDAQTGITLRTMEAICYNKRLLTNNPMIKELEFYKSGFIQYFDNIEDIDVAFVLDRRPVNYHYQGEFSPIHFIEHINSL